MTHNNSTGNFWDHLDILRSVIIKIIVIWSIITIIAFFFKTEIFDFILAPKSDKFITYRFIDALCMKFSLESLEPVHVQLINTGLAQQFIIHMKTAMCVGLILTVPYSLYEIFRFISPALYNSERRYTVRIITNGYFMFIIGLSLSYLIIFPMTFQFLGSYQVDEEVLNMISLDSYMSSLIMMSLCMGVICELPVLAWLFAKMGLINSTLMNTYRKHAIVIILIVAAIITPTSDIFTLLLVSIPIWLLYEISVVIVGRTSKKSVLQPISGLSVQ